VKPYEGADLGDWRDQYVMCEHIAALPKGADGAASTKGVRHSGFRICCEACYPTFLFPEEKVVE
jgi:hypothetical protein